MRPKQFPPWNPWCLKKYLEAAAECQTAPKVLNESTIIIVSYKSSAPCTINISMRSVGCSSQLALLTAVVCSNQDEWELFGARAVLNADLV